MKENLTAKLYSDILLDEWSSKKNIWKEEEYFIRKYLTDTSQRVLEAGTGGGRISFYIETLGFMFIDAFDISPEMIEIAIKKGNEQGTKIKFSCCDASNLSCFEDQSFGYSIYLQQVLSMISDPTNFYSALEESYRVSKHGGITIFSFLDYHGRSYNPALSFVLSIVRKIRSEKINYNVLPWLKYIGKINWNFFNRNQPLLTWVIKEKIFLNLQKIGFSIIDVRNDSQIFEQTNNRIGGIYFVCKKE